MCVTGVVNRGDSFRRRRSRSNSLAPAEQETEVRRAPPKEVASHTVAMLGARGVGKTALISQFMTSECINAYDRQRGESARVSNRESRIVIIKTRFSRDSESNVCYAFLSLSFLPIFSFIFPIFSERWRTLSAIKRYSELNIRKRISRRKLR